MPSPVNTLIPINRSDNSGWMLGSPGLSKDSKAIAPPPRKPSRATLSMRPLAPSACQRRYTGDPQVDQDCAGEQDQN